MKKRKPNRKEDTDNKYSKYLESLFAKAIKKNSLEAIHAILEVSGMYYGHWNPTEESFQFIEDFDHARIEAIKTNNHKRKYRIDLMIYCHLVEMNFAHNILMNTLRVINGEHYVIKPFAYSKLKPLSSRWKFDEIKKKAKEINEKTLTDYIDEFYSDDIRNAFYHSDYCIADKGFRYERRVDKKMAYDEEISLDEINKLIKNCFDFYVALFNVHKWTKEWWAKQKKFHKCPGYEVLELLIKDNMLYGFNMHFSNDSKATFTREPENVKAMNISFNKDGSVNFFVGDLDKLKKEWRVNGENFDEISGLI